MWEIFFAPFETVLLFMGNLRYRPTAKKKLPAEKSL
jgi:hypothetical protein